MSCPSEDTLHLKAGYLNRLPLTLDDGTNPIDLTGSTIRLVARASSEDDPLFEIEVTDHLDAEAGESSVDVDLTEVSDEILATGLRLNAEIVVLDSTGVLVFAEFFTLQIQPKLDA
jgi:hypothetical protein